MSKWETTGYSNNGKIKTQKAIIKGKEYIKSTSYDGSGRVTNIENFIFSEEIGELVEQGESIFYEEGKRSLLINYKNGKEVEKVYS